MNRITEALKSLLPEGQINEVAKAVEQMMAEHEASLKKQYDQRLTEAYDKLAEEVEEAEATAYKGYQQAYEIIADLMNRLDVQREQLENEREQGFEEAFNKIKEAEEKNNNLEVELYEEFDNKLKAMKSLMVDKLDEFLGEQEAEMYDEAKKNILSDPRLLEQRVAVERMADILSDYMGSNSGVSSRKLQEAVQSIEDLKGQLRVVEARNVKLSMQNNKLNEQNNNLNEQARKAEQLITEAQKAERKNRTESKQNASGRGKRNYSDELIQEFNNPVVNKNKQEVVSESSEHNALNDLLILSGIQESE